jgi:hypothetical protein
MQLARTLTGGVGLDHIASDRGEFALAHGLQGVSLNHMADLVG